jgi:hypothetical protein
MKIYHLRDSRKVKIQCRWCWTAWQESVNKSRKDIKAKWNSSEECCTKTDQSRLREIQKLQ